jgi:hypothetical protein
LAFTLFLARVQSIVLTAFTAFAIGTAVATHAVIQIANAFLAMLGANAIGGVLVATVAGVAAVIIFDMAGRAFHVVITVKHKGFVVVKRCRLPGSL